MLGVTGKQQTNSTQRTEAGPLTLGLCVIAYSFMRWGIMAADSHTPTHAGGSTVGAIDIDKNAAEPHDVLLEVGPGGRRRQRFVGRKVGEAREFTTVGIEVIRVYLSRKGKYVVHRQRTDWVDFALTNWTGDLANWRELFDVDDQTWADYEVEIVDSVEDLVGRVPSRIYRGLFGSEERPKIEDLDI